MPKNQRVVRSSNCVKKTLILNVVAVVVIIPIVTAFRREATSTLRLPNYLPLKEIKSFHFLLCMYDR